MKLETSRRSVLASGLGLAAISAVGPGAAMARAADEKPVRIGVLLDTSGPAATHGKRQLLGVRHQAEQINAGPGPGVTLVVRDTQGDPAVTNTLAQDLVGGVDALIGTSMPWTSQVVMAVAQRAGVPVIAPIMDSPPTQPFAFMTGASTRQTTRETMRSMAAAKLSKAGLIILDRLATPDRMTTFDEEAKAHGVDMVAVEKFPDSSTTLVGPLKALVSAGSDTVVVAGPPPFNSMAVRELRALPWPGRIICSAAAGHPAFLTQAGKAAEGVRVTAPWTQLGEQAPDTLPNSWAIRQFVATFTPRHGPVGSFAGHGVDAVGMIHVAYAGHRDRALARTVLEHMTYVGVTGVFSRAPDNHAGLADDAITTVVIRGGRWAPEDGLP